MSSISDNIVPAQTEPTRPEHHVHRDSEPLPGARGGAPAADYSANNMERLPSSAWQDADPTQPTREMGEEPERPEIDHRTDEIAGEPGRTAMDRTNSSTSGNLQFTEPHRDTTPSGVAVDDTHDNNKPTRKPTAADKLIGKAQQTMGKVAHKPQLQEKGELRATEGKAALQDLH